MALLDLEQIGKLAGLFGPAGKKAKPSPGVGGGESVEDDETKPAHADLTAKLEFEFEWNPRLKARWSGDDSGLTDTSRSGMDMSVVGMLKAAGWRERRV